MTFDISKISIPSHPGIYIMKDETEKILYIGKAKNLKNRVRSYFLKNQNYKTQKLVEKITDIEFILTDNEEEAFLLEANMIKRYRPPYNIELKDQQRYTYLRITNEEFPRLMVARRTRTGQFLGGGKMYGPFTHGSSKMLSIGLLRKTFKIRICKKLPKEACLEYHLGNCDAPCQFKQAREDYNKHISDLESILKGKQQLEDFVKNLEKEMIQASENRQYEKAKEIHETLQRLGNLQVRQKMESPRIGSNEEYFGIKIKDQTAHLMSFRLSNGVIKDRNKFSFDLVGDNTFSSFLSQYYSTNPIPRHVIVSEMPDKKEVLEEVFARSSGFTVHITVPTTGKRREIIDLIMKNISLEITKGADPALVELQERLGLQDIPRIIECFDISNHGADYAVGSMSCVVDGKPQTSGYRKFKIKTVQGRDDFAMINEIVKRRYLRLKEEKSKMPDLILIDGGRGQLNAALDAMHAIGIDIPCVSLAKENEEVYQPRVSKPLVMAKTNPALKVLQHARDEAHRFGVAYNRAIRKFT
ncbi:MAG: excinuclease ABC subunit UvrC [Thaumarchaeota archaeon]|nr:excinuclease ABC subunit UvrC [Nitrososphaerota archaeon]MDE1830852.1 excinuclease ABC subunit UvrC [Nitrososphaerota archaeon]MDE1841112.1 excinuclease ABC subunit UvrC [Nitrososphaerota archaeon]MDE1876950.1 excinuclease ABC subunit UvrC [Nitrososphaerota archaeon]